MWTVDEMFRKAEDLNRCQKMHSKCEVQTLYSPGIAQDCVVMTGKVENSNKRISDSQQI